MKMKMILSTTESRMDGMREREWGVYKGMCIGGVRKGRAGKRREAKAKFFDIVGNHACLEGEGEKYLFNLHSSNKNHLS